MEIRIPEFSLVVLIGEEHTGKTTFAKQFFNDKEIFCTEYCETLLSGDDAPVYKHDSFGLLHSIVTKRLKNGNLTVVDEENLTQSMREKLIQITKKADCYPVAIYFKGKGNLHHEQNLERLKGLSDDAIVRQLKKERFKYVYIIGDDHQFDEVRIIKDLSPSNLKTEQGPFDIIGDVHGCYDELEHLLTKLGYTIKRDIKSKYGFDVIAPKNRKVIFVGDLTDRGPNVVDCFKLAMTMIDEKQAFCVMGNHEAKLLKKLNGRNVKLKHGLEITMEQLEHETEEFKEQLRNFVDQLAIHLEFDNGNLVVAHAGLPERYHGKKSGKIRSFALYGDVAGFDEEGRPIRKDWSLDYEGNATVVYGHVPRKEYYISNKTYGIDTGCVFGGKLTCLQYPELVLVQVQANRVYSEHRDF
ncbi:metallophosphoesterase [Haloplasma contractile]|uniref:Bis-tetraphosphatase protein n=1 Tax=Haloplasma contractile SSD-17B TaxID=1033810 RepID=U2FGV1_9MOLU|nr:metallophosphoesterase [Haloplasma contractile]ERJ12080.1 bis-tetraphosphatase protein [Haloplasma contractile SSD-17B]